MKKSELKQIIREELNEFARMATNIKKGDRMIKITDFKSDKAQKLLIQMNKIVMDAGEGGISRPELARKLGKSQPAINSIINALIAKEVFANTGDIKPAGEPKAAKPKTAEKPKETPKPVDHNEFDMEDKGPDYNNISDLEYELGRLIRWSNQYGSKGADTKIEQLRKRIDQLKNQVNKPKPVEKPKEQPKPVEKSKGIQSQLDALETNDYQNRKGDYPRDGVADSIQAYNNGLAFEFKNTDEEQAKRWVKNFLRNKGLDDKLKGISSEQTGDYRDDWVTVDAKF
jgi:hypothetical protein